MPRQFSPRTVLRRVSNVLLREFFEQEGHPLALNWGEMAEGQIDPVFEGWQALPDADRKRVELTSRDINEMGTEDGIRAIIQDAQLHGVALGSEFDDLESLFDKAMWTCLNHRAVWDTAVIFTHADHLPGRYWSRRSDLPECNPLHNDS